MPSINPLRTIIRGKKRYHSLPLHQKKRASTSYTEKHHTLSDEEYTDYASDSSSVSVLDVGSTSSRRTSASDLSAAPMLEKRRSARALARDIRYRLPRRIIQGICWMLIFMVAGFIFFLIRMSHESRRSLADHKPTIVPQWESFSFLTKYYGGLRSLKPLSENQPEYPVTEANEEAINETRSEIQKDSIRAVPVSKSWNAYSRFNSREFLDKYVPVQRCFVDEGETVRIPALQYYEGRPSGFPNPVMGSYDVMGLPENTCFDRYGKSGPYGHGYETRLGGTGTGLHGDKEGAEAVWRDSERVDYSNIDWAAAQKRCFARNAARFNTTMSDLTITMPSPVNRNEKNEAIDAEHNATRPNKQLLPRTAVVVRTWDSYNYHEEDILYLRSLIAELSLGSGGEYDVHLLVQVQDETVAIWADQTVYHNYLQKVVPKEFWGIATLWTESQNPLFYPGLEETWARGPNFPVYGVYRGLTMALQFFAIDHPEYEFFWQWEMDIRYTGHYYTLFEQFSAWSRSQPRKGLWERNARFYIPSVHGTWEDFMHMVRVQTEQGIESAGNVWSSLDKEFSHKGPVADKPIWGPERPAESAQFETESDPVPPVPYNKDKYVWGVGEDADLITLNPVFDPAGTTWGLAEDVTGYNKSNGMPPRRSAIITASRISRKLLTMMHKETAMAKHHAFSEMWPATCALHHGYKVVYVPHPMYVDRRWPVSYLAAVMNAGRNGATGGARTSVFGEREHNFRGFSWYYNAGFAGNIWKRWLGLKVDNDGGEQFETDGEQGKGGDGRMCLPPMLLHPVKNIELAAE